MSVASKIVQVIQSVNAIKKDSSNNYQGYQYTSADKFLAEIRKPMCDAGLVCLPAHIGTNINEGVYILRYEFTLLDVDDPESVVTLPWMHTIPVLAKGKKGDYLDDKALGKSQTYAHRYFLMKLFLITDQESELEEIDSNTQYANAPAVDAKTELWQRLKTDSEINARYHVEHLKNTLAKYDGDVVADGFDTVKSWLLSRESTS